MKKLRFIINPISGIGKKNKLPGLIEKYIDHSRFEHDIVYTQARGHGAQLAKEAVIEGIDIVCAVGGDGSVHEIGGELINTSVALAILPCGSGNGFARHLKLEMRLVKAIKTINLERYRKVDTALANGKAYLGVAGFGFDALIAKKFDEYHKRGMLSYIKLVLSAFFSYKAQQIEIDGELQKDLLFCTVANGSQFGNGFSIAPNASVEDGELEVLKLKIFPWWQTPVLVLRFFNASIHKSKYATLMSIKNVNLKVESKLMHLDGEPMDTEEEVNISILPKSLNVLVGKKY